MAQTRRSLRRVRLVRCSRACLLCRSSSSWSPDEEECSCNRRRLVFVSQIGSITRWVQKKEGLTSFEASASSSTRIPPVSTIEKLTPFQVQSAMETSRVVPGTELTRARFCPTNLLNRVDLPTFGLPTITTRGLGWRSFLRTRMGLVGGSSRSSSFKLLLVLLLDEKEASELYSLKP